MSVWGNVLITGSNRGVGLGLVKHLLKQNLTQHLFACCRKPDAATDLQQLSVDYPCLHILQLDVSDTSKYCDVKDEVKKVVGEAGLNVLINNAAIFPKPSNFDDVTFEQMTSTYEVNVAAPLMLTKALYPLLKTAASSSSESVMSIRRAAVINVSSKVGSFDVTTSASAYPYRCSKAALNMVTKLLSIEFSESSILVCSVHPGWVQTEMGGPNALISTDESSSSLVNTLSSLTPGHHGGFVNFNGDNILW